MTVDYSGKSVLVTGGAGFLGSHLCRKLLALGADNVICLDNLYSGSKANIWDLMSDVRFEFIRHDVTFPMYYEVDQIFNLACPASPVHYQADPVQTLKTSVHGAINLLGLAKRTGARIMQASTSEIYGDPEIHPQNESYWGNVNPIGIRSCYDEGKRCAETLFFDYHRQHGVDIRVARIFNTYGPNMQINDGRVVSNFIVQSLMNKNITIYGDGSQTRSFCYVSDLIDALILLMASEYVDSPVNVGNPNERSIRDLAATVIDYVGSSSSIVFKQLPSDDPRRRRPSIEKAREHLGWEPKVSFEDGLEATVTYFKSVIPER